MAVAAAVADAAVGSAEATLGEGRDSGATTGTTVGGGLTHFSLEPGPVASAQMLTL